jgi:hypothetical protein
MPRPALTITPPDSPGRCRECGCTDHQACADPETGEACWWANDARTVCSLCALLYTCQVLVPIAEGGAFPLQ